MKEEAAEIATEPIETKEEAKVLTEDIVSLEELFVEDYMKEVRRLRKKLRQIDELIVKKESGTVLE